MLLLGAIGSFCPPSPASSFVAHDDILIPRTTNTNANANTRAGPSSSRRYGRIVESNDHDDGIVVGVDDLHVVGTTTRPATDRRSFVANGAIAWTTILIGCASSSTRAGASGGATAGGAYLLSGKCGRVVRRECK